MEIEQIKWSDFQNGFRWRQGEHVMAIAPTGAGKTRLFSELLPYRKNNIFFGTKLDDDSYRLIMKKTKARRVDSITEIKPWDRNVMLWPHYGANIGETYAIQRRAFLEALNVIVKQGGWTVWADEMKYMTQQLKLERELTFILEQLRSIKGTIIGGAQRPRWLPLSALTNATHVFLWRTNLAEDAKRLADIGGIDAKMVIEEMHTLDDHEFIYIRSRGASARLVRSQVGKE